MPAIIKINCLFQGNSSTVNREQYNVQRQNRICSRQIHKEEEKKVSEF